MLIEHKTAPPDIEELFNGALEREYMAVIQKEAAFAWRRTEPKPRMRHMERKALLSFLEAVPDETKSVEERLAEIDERFATNRRRTPPRIASRSVTGKAFQLFSKENKKGRKARKMKALLDRMPTASDEERVKIVAQYNSYVTPKHVAFNWAPELDKTLKNELKRERRARRSK